MAESNNAPLKIGYARVSTEAQNLDMQVSALKEYGINPKLIFTDKMTGGTQKRPGLNLALKCAQREGTEFVVWKIDRLGRSVIGVIETLDLLRNRGVVIKSLTEPIDTSTPMGEFVLNILISLAQMERDLIRERTIAGLERAKKRGQTHGRPAVIKGKRAALANKLFATGERGKLVWDALSELSGPKIGRSAYYNFQKAWIENHPPDDDVDDR